MRPGLRFALLSLVLALVFPASAAAFGQLSSFGELGGGPGQLDAPKQAAFDAAGDLFVADSGNDRISVFAGDGNFLGTLTGSMDDPQDVAFGAGGQVFVADKGNDRVDVFGSTGEFIRQIGEGELEDPSGVAVDGSTVYVADSGHNRVAVFSVTGFELTEISGVPSARDVVVGADGNLYVADFGEERIDVFTKGGAFLRSFGETGLGALNGPVALAPDGSGGIYVADQEDERVERFSEAGVFLSGFAAEPNVAGVAAACGGNLFAVEEGASVARIVRFGEPGTPPPPCLDSLQHEPIVDPVVQLPSNRFRFAGLVKNRSNGSAVLFVRVPGQGRVLLRGRGFRRLARTAPRAKRVRLPVKPKIPLKRFLKRHGKGRIRVEVTFKPTGGVPRTLEKVIVLKRRRG